MSLADQIRAAAEAPKPVSAQGTLREIRLRNLLLGAKAQKERALVRYHDVMCGKGWITQSQIENALGYAATVSTAYLAKLLARGHVERRNRDNAPVFMRQRGYEWRWKEQPGENDE